MHFIGATAPQKGLSFSVVFWVILLLGCIAAVSLICVRQDGKRRAEQRRRRQEAERDRQRQRRELHHSMRQRLDRDCAEILRRAEAAVKFILASTARAKDLLDSPVDENLLFQAYYCKSVDLMTLAAPCANCRPPS